MSERNAYRRKAIREENEETGDGVAARIAERLFENPAMSGGLVVMALTAAAIISNAMLMQNARHPEPLFSTRSSAASTKARAPVEVPLPRARIDQIAADIATPVPKPATASSPPTRDEIAALQRELTGKGFYNGPIDGITGSRTRAAITAYQQAAGLEVTGEPTPTILDHMRTATVRQAPVPPARPGADAPKLEAAPVIPAKATVPETSEVEPLPLGGGAETDAPADSPSTEPAASASLPAPADSAALERAIDEAEMPAVTEPLPEVAVAPAAPDPETVARERYRAVQHALNEIGYGPVSEDGVAAGETTDAIRRFELDNGLPLTGEAGDRVVDRLVAIGAMKAI